MPDLFDDPEPIKAIRAAEHWKLILRVARTLPGHFTLADLAVACHQAAPEQFGMRGYRHFPDIHKTAAYLYGTRGLVALGLVRRVGKGLFDVPRAPEGV